MTTGVISKLQSHIRNRLSSSSRYKQLWLIGCSVLLLLIITIHQPVNSQTQTINLARSVHQPGFTTEIFKQLLEELDYQVEVTEPISDREFYISAATGKIDLWVNGVFPKHQSFFVNETIRQNLQVFDSLIQNNQNCQQISCDRKSSSSNDFKAVANKKFLGTHPQIKKLLEIIKIPLEDINTYNSLLQENSNQQLLQQYAQEWITNNEGRVKLWLAIARDEAIFAEAEKQMVLSDYGIVRQQSQANNQNPQQTVPVGDFKPLAFPLIRVVTKRFEPFVNYEDGEYTGFSIDLWDAIARELKIDYEMYRVDTIDNLLEQVKTQKADIAIAGITITAERERQIDFSHFYYESGLQILVPQRNASLSQTMWGRIFAIVTNPQLYRGLGIFILVLLVAAHLIWLTEHKHNPEFPDSYFQGIWESFWWAAVTVTTVGYGDKTPRKLGGRIFGLFWMCAGYFIFAYFTATVTTSFTIQELNANIQGIEDLRGKNVATVMGTTTDKYLKKENIDFIGYKTKEEAYLALQDQEVDAVVYDAPALQYYVAHEGKGKVKVVGKLFELQNYGIALPLNSPYRKEINSALLKLMEDNTYQEISNKWFGS
ncbi:MAG: transporter substrate-binding domain-containing protein [Xenococcaceae cyanobacterium MO_207.B15]|nr:transporter substrate-binding domain-containing protein [Xenococcaceae cyanobacterium MO_207.B15]